jgi:CCR4-NOT transcription complex subunit 6
MKTPVIITGDFNSMPNSGMYELYSSGKLSGTHADLLKEPVKDISHNFSLQSAYASLGEPITNYTNSFKG